VRLIHNHNYVTVIRLTLLPSNTWYSCSMGCICLNAVPVYGSGVASLQANVLYSYVVNWSTRQLVSGCVQ